MVQVQVKDGNLDDALRRLKKLLDKDGVLKQIRFREIDGGKPSVRRKRKAGRARKRNARNEKRRKMYGS